MDVSSDFHKREIPSFVDEEFYNFSIGKGKKNVKVSLLNVLAPITLIGKAKRVRAKEAAAQAEKAKQVAEEKALKLENAKTDAEIARAEADIKIAKAEEIKATANAISAEAEAKIAESNVKKVEADIKKVEEETKVAEPSPKKVETVAVGTELTLGTDEVLTNKPKSDKKLMYIGGGIAVLVISYLLFKKK
jgi:hypothetical protein